MFASNRLTDGKMKHIAFMLDPDNYVCVIQLIQQTPFTDLLFVVD